MRTKKTGKTEKAEKLPEDSVCSGCWRYETFKSDCIYFWENKSECSKFMRHMNDEERHVRKEPL